MKCGTKITTTYPVRCEEGFIPPGTDGMTQAAVGENAHECKFTDLEIETSRGTKVITAIITILNGWFYERPNQVTK